jgi:hypothetical protein
LIRHDHVLHEMEPSAWTRDEVLNHLKKTFELACRDFPDILEPYVIRISDGLSVEETKQSMRAALRETFNQRWPNRFVQPLKET